MIPFQYGVVVGKENFCGREEHVKQIKQYIESSQNIILIGERRIGKTSLIYESVRRIKSHQAIIVDLMGVKTTNDLFKRFIFGIAKAETPLFLLTRNLSISKLYFQ